MSPRHALVLAVPVVLALGLGASGAVAMDPPDSPVRPRIAPQPSVDLERLPDPSVVADGPVTDVVQSGDRVYAVGSFTEIGRYSGPGRILDTATGADEPAPVLDDGQVSVVLADGTDGWYVAGDAHGGVVHVLADGSVDPAFTVEVQGLVNAIARDGDTLYIGGMFGQVNEVDRTNLAAISATTGSLESFHTGPLGHVAELAVDADTLWVGTAKSVVSLDRATGDARWSTAFGNDVRALALGDGVIYVGVHGVRAIDPATGDPVGGFADAVVDGTVHSLLLDGDRLYVGTDGTDGSSKLIAVDPQTGAADASFDPEVVGGVASWGAPGGVFDLALDGDRLWVGGAFTQAAGHAVRGLAVVDAATGAAEDVDLPRFHEQVNAVEVSGGSAYVGGHFYLADPSRTRGVAALDAETMLPVPGFRTTDAIRPGDLTVATNALYVAQTNFTGYAPYVDEPPYFSNQRSTIYAYDPDTGAVLPRRTHTVENLTGITTLGGSLVTAQRLENDQRFPRNRVTVYALNGRRLTSWLVPLRGYITDLDVIGTDLLVAGSFKRSAPNGGRRNTALIRLDLETGERRPYFDPHIHGPLNDISVSGSSIYASGLFHQVFQAPDSGRPGLVKLNARSVMSEQFQPRIRGGDNPFQSATAVGDLVWSKAADQRFLDAATGERFDPTDGMLEHSWLYAVTGDADTLVLGGQEWTSLAGEGALPVGFVTAFAH